MSGTRDGLKERASSDSKVCEKKSGRKAAEVTWMMAVIIRVIIHSDAQKKGGEYVVCVCVCICARARHREEVGREGTQGRRCGWAKMIPHSPPRTASLPRRTGSGAAVTR